MSSPTEHSTPSGGTPDQRGELLEQYILTMAEGKIRTEVGEDDARVRAFVEAHPELIRVTDELRASWSGELTGRMVEIPPRAGAPLEALDRDIRRWEGFKGQLLRGNLWYALAGMGLTVLAIMVGRHIELPHGSEHAGMPVSTYVTGNGERAKIMLPDGNTVALNTASRLEVPADYLEGDHTLRLNGEALFTIQHHGDVPVTVLAGSTTARVLGTSFMVRHYVTDTVTTVAVREGKVAVGTAVLTENRMIEVRRNGAAVTRIARPAQFSFATGVLTLDDAYLPEVIPELDRWYDADIRLGDPILAKRDMGGTFAAGSLAELATNLELMLNVRVVRDGRVLTLYPR